METNCCNLLTLGLSGIVPNSVLKHIMSNFHLLYSYFVIYKLEPLFKYTELSKGLEIFKAYSHGVCRDIKRNDEAEDVQFPYKYKTCQLLHAINRYNYYKIAIKMMKPVILENLCKCRR